MEAQSVLFGLQPFEKVGDPEVCIAVLDGPVDLSHPCFDGADLTRVDTLVQEPAGQGPMSLHGTHVASMLFSQPGHAVVGIAPRCRGLILPVFRDGREGWVPQLDLARAIERAVHEGAHIISVSGGERTPDGRADSLLQRALQLCEDNGVLVVAAVGNDGCDCLQVPASVPSVLAVGATGPEGEPLKSNNWGAAYRTNGVLAPGRDIVGAAPGGGLTSLTGSSFATPVVSGVAALLVAAQLRAGQPPDPYDAARCVIASASYPAGGASDRRRYFNGRLDAANALRLVTRPESTARALAAAAEPEAPPRLPGGRLSRVVLPAQGRDAAGDPSPPAASTLESSKGASIMTTNQVNSADQGSADTVPVSGGGGTGVGEAVQEAGDSGSIGGIGTPAGGRAEGAGGHDLTAGAAPAGAAPAEIGQASPVAPPGEGPGPATVAGAEGSPGPGLRASCGPGHSGATEGGAAPDCACKANGRRPLVFALGTVGFDFQTEANRDSFRQLMSSTSGPEHDGVPTRIPADPYNPYQLRTYLSQNPWASDKLTWTLVMDSTPIYALEAENPAGMDWSEPPVLDPLWDGDQLLEEKQLQQIVQQPDKLAQILIRLSSPPVNRVYRMFRDAIVGQAAGVDNPDYVSRVSIPGVLTDRTVQLYSGERLPVVQVDARGIYTWNETELVKAISEQVRTDTDRREVRISDLTVQKTIRAMLDKIYYQFRNLGQSSADRALNYAATNAFVFGQQISEGLLSAKHVPGPEDRFYALDTISVSKSPYCRSDSDCQLVRIVFFDPEDERRSKVTFMFTIDVSRVIPIPLAPPRVFLGDR
ncbi:S8 family serine peptidase [Streptomyces erythrochromogenes]|uniref:cyanobactin maturation protease PatG family protein n=1 Tax=Streptomyces erythrochromogenes TaxID=285574 RepID=UPI0033C116CC